MDIKQYNDDQTASWEYLPDTDILIEYLDRKDLIELSQCCKRYRNQLERRILKSLVLITSKSNKCGFSREPRGSCNLEEPLEFLKIDLGSKLKFVNTFTLNCNINYRFAEIFVNLLPNIKTLFIYGCKYCMRGCCVSTCNLGRFLGDILEGMARLEHLYISGIDGKFDVFLTPNPIFPKSIKSLKFGDLYTQFYDDDLLICDTIDTSYINLYSLTIVSNRMLQNLSSGMPNLREVEIKYNMDLDTSEHVAFLKANPQLKKLNTERISYNEEIFKIILSYQYLEHWSIYKGFWEGVVVNNIPSSYSIKYLQISCSIPDLLNLLLINACINLNTLEVEIDRDFNNLDWSKLERRINKLKLKLKYVHNTSNTIKKIDALRLFNIIYIELDACVKYDINMLINFSLSNYEFIPSTSKYCTLKLNKTD